MANLQVKRIAKVVPDGYHGTGLSIAKKIVREGKFEPSHGEKQYLGDGIYFFEGSQKHAEIWAGRKNCQYCGVLRAEIKLGRCLDLNTHEHIRILEIVARELTKRLNDSKDLELTDAFVINYYATNIEARLDTVRWTNTKTWREEIYRGSKIRLSELIICVRNAACISDITLVWEGISS